jgi:hypothetical protein
MHEEILKSDLIEMSYGENIIGGGIKLQFCNRKGSIDYSKIPELIDVDLEKYRKNGTRYALIK